jgi:putative endonuclease
MGKREQSRGFLAETIAAETLQKKGFTILERNWTCQQGELDLIAQDHETIVIIEVKSRGSKAFGSPEDSITSVKGNRIVKAASTYLHKKGLLDCAWRIDVVAIEFDARGNLERLTHYENAITGDEVNWE